jgi:GWxTD domain-containing protein
LGPNGELISDLSINYTLIERGENQRFIADSGTFNTTIYKKGANKYYITQIPVKAQTGKSYHLKVILRDKLKRNFNLSFLEVEKRPEIGQQFFNITRIDGEPIFKNVIIGNASVRILHSQPKSDKLFISYFKHDSELPQPTFAAESYEAEYNKPDSIYIIKYSTKSAIQFIHDGMYFIQFDTTTDYGVSLSKFDENFPRIKTPENLVEPLAYLTTSAEYNKLVASENKKLAVDNFWIHAGGSTDRGRELIRIYYNRVYFSNYYFTTTKAGWKTDRGMVFTVYGPPQNLKKTAESETWYYYFKGGGEAISFTFLYSPNKFTINNYVLKRSESNTWHWREAVYSWNTGKIFLQD